ncbi:MAG: GH3 auxin-responsive promoter family protein, partial [Parabacteroides sp.]|nr:GH3 auxin-responsive promoter family protein [Parabacteroides sp.]
MDNHMNITKEWLLAPNDQLGTILSAGYADPQSVQERLLTDILESASHCEIGSKFDFATIRSVQEFQQRMPLTDWHDVEPYSDRMVNGAEDLLFPGRPQQFVKTSGTTGKDKLIPESQMSDAARALIQKLRMAQYLQAVPVLKMILANPKEAGRCLLPLTNAPVWSKTTNGIPCVSASGLTIGQTGMDHLMAFPLFVLLNSDEHVRDYLIMRFAIECENILLIAGNNAGRLTALVRMAQSYQEELLNDIEQGTVSVWEQVDSSIREKLISWLQPNPQRAETLRSLLKEGKPFTPATYWPALQLGLFWLSASVGRYVDELRPYLPATACLMDVGYGASEAKFNIPLVPEDPSGILSIATAFYEFLPLENNSLNTPLLCHELEVGKQYELIVTTWGGLYRYQMKDVV